MALCTHPPSSLPCFAEAAAVQQLQETQAAAQRAQQQLAAQVTSLQVVALAHAAHAAPFRSPVPICL